jgi:hypothetical protein
MPTRGPPIVANRSIIPEILQKHEKEIFEEWIANLKGGRGKVGRLKEGEIDTQAHDVLGALRAATEDGVESDMTGERYGPLREILSNIRARALSNRSRRRKPRRSCSRSKSPFSIALERRSAMRRRFGEKFGL